MDTTLLIALLAATVSLLLFGATVVLVGVLVIFVWKSRRAARLALEAGSSSSSDAATPTPAAERDTLVPPASPLGGSTSGPLENGGLIGFFDDESSGPGLEGAKTELFQPKKGVEWGEDNSEEGEATEIFSAHGAAAGLAEFAFDEVDEATGRFSKSGEPR